MIRGPAPDPREKIDLTDLISTAASERPPPSWTTDLAAAYEDVAEHRAAVLLPCKVQDQPLINRRKSHHIFFFVIKHCARVHSPIGQIALRATRARKKKEF